MNATSLDELRGSLAGRGNVDEKMQQVRELLVGEDLRHMEARLAATDLRLKELERSLGNRLDALAARLDALAGEMTAERRSSFEQLAKTIVGLGDDIRRIGKD